MSGKRRIRVLASASAAATLALAALAANAAAPGSLRPIGEFLSNGVSNAAGVAVSPDGEQVYGVGFASDDILTLNRNAATGAVTFEDITNDPPDLNGPNAIEISPDGENAYVAGDLSSSVHAFERSPSDGQLTPIQAFLDDTNGVTALGGAYDVAVAGPHVYVTGAEGDGVVVFNRDGDGELSFNDEYINGLEGIANMDTPRGIAISPNGRNVYVAGFQNRAIVTFRRFPATGQLDFVESDVFPAPAEDVAVSPDGTRVYGGFDNGVVTFRRNPSTGAITSLGDTGDDVLGVYGVAVTADGGNVYTSRDLITDGIATLEARASGPAVFRGLIEPEEFTEPFGVAVSPDARHVYLSGGSTGDGHIASYSRQPELVLKGKKKQDAGEKLKVKAECSADCTAKLKAKGYKTAKKDLVAGKPKTMKLKPKGSAPDDGKVKVKGKGIAGNRSDKDGFKVKLK